MVLHPNEQRILRYLEDKDGASRSELENHFSLMLSSLIDFYLTRLAQDGLVEVVEGRICATTASQGLVGDLPEVPVSALTVLDGGG
jgi:hypothetical protein